LKSLLGFHEGDASSPGNYKALDLHLRLSTLLQLHALVIPQGGCLPLYIKCWQKLLSVNGGLLM